MENKISNKLEKYQLAFKDAIKEWMKNNQTVIMCESKAEGKADTCKADTCKADTCKVDKTSEFLQFIYDYSKLEINKEDLQKRTRVKNVVPFCELCTAKIAIGIQCTRRKQNADSPFCGTHIKGQPYGIETTKDKTKQQTKKIEIWAQEIKGINYYIDIENNVYKPEDIISNIQNPAVIAKWALSESNNYVIPAFGI
jgi:hypothetical protein